MRGVNFMRPGHMAPYDHRHSHAASRRSLHHSHGHSSLHAARQEQEEEVATLLTRASEDAPSDKDDNMINLMLIILSIVFFALILVSVYFFIRRARQRRARALQKPGDEVLPSYDDAKLNGSNNVRALTIETTHNGRSNVLVLGRDGQPMLSNPNSPPHSPDNVPQIHITFPDEQDEGGRTRGGRVLVVRVGDNAAVGLEPMNDEQLPAYEKDAKSQFYSLDMDDIGGLKEKDRSMFQ